MAADWPGATKATEALARMLDRYDLLPGRFELAGDEAGKEADIESPDDLRELFHESGLLVSGGRPVLVYIRDHIVMTPDPLTPEECRKVHFTACQALHRMDAAGRFERYRRTMSESNIYVIDVSSGRGVVSEVWTRLYPCQYCLGNARYLGFSYTMSKQERRRIVEVFDARVIMEILRRHLRRFSKRDVVDPYRLLARIARDLLERMRNLRSAGLSTNYPKNWSSISKNYREAVKHICECCRVSLKESEMQRLLHVHHVNGDKSNNTASNLQALCVLCHRARDLHLPVSERVVECVRRARRVQRRSGTPIQDCGCD